MIAFVLIMIVFPLVSAIDTNSTPDYISVEVFNREISSQNARLQSMQSRLIDQGNQLSDLKSKIDIIIVQQGQLLKDNQTTRDTISQAEITFDADTQFIHENNTLNRRVTLGGVFAIITFYAGVMFIIRWKLKL